MQKYALQILDQNDIPIGAAFLVYDDLLLTCAHVVRAAGSAVGQAVSLRTPSGTELSATVETWRDESAEDIASLRLDTPLDEMQALPLGASNGSHLHRFSTYGFPQPDQALSGSGTITGYATLNGIQYLQLESSQVTPGFSGAPVFDEITKRMVGMVVAIAPPDEYQRQGTTAFAVPAETLREVCGLALSDLCPYRSLDAFTEADANLFFGRERVVTKLLESLKRNPRFLAVLGPSGSGKSSVVQAGLIPALRSGQLSGSEKWGILSIRPGTQPFEQLSSAGMSDPTNLVQAASDWLSAHPQNERLLILIDQFEELLVSTPSDTRAEFIAALADLLDSSLDVTVLLTLRDDFYNRFTQEAGDLVDWMEAALVNIPPTLEEAELREIIARPARDLGLVFAPGLVEAIFSDARTADPGGRAIRSTVLPLLEFALTQLWERRVEGELTHAAYRAMGAVTGGLSQWADRAYYALNEGQRAIARRVFSELVTLGDETQGIADTRRVRNIAELTAKDGEQTKSVLDALVAARLLVARHDESSGQDTVEIIHETLLREWGLLEGWLQDDRQFLLWREGLRAAQGAWQESGQDAGALLRGAPLAEAESWLEKRGDDLGDAEKNYITKSIALRVRGERNRRWVMAGLGMVAVLMAGLAFWGSSSANSEREQRTTAEAASTLAMENEENAQRQAATAQAERDKSEAQARVAQANQSAAFSLNYLDKKLDLALLLAAQSTQQIENFQTRNALLSALQYSPKLIQILPGHTGHVWSVAFSPDGKILASGSGDNTIRLWDVNTGQQVGEPLQGHSRAVYSVVFSPDGSMLASGSRDNSIRLWDVKTGEQIGAPFQGHTSVVNSVAFSPSGEILASGSGDNSIQLWDVNTGKQIGVPLQGHTRGVWSIAFSPSGEILASGSSDHSIRLWDMRTGQQIGTPLQGHSWFVNSVAFSPSGEILASGSGDNSIRLWDVNTGKQIGPPLQGHSGDVWSVAFSPDGKILASGSGDNTIRLWNVNTGQQVGEPLIGHGEWIKSVVFSPDGTALASGSNDDSVFLWDLERDELLSKSLIGHDGFVSDITFSPDGSILASVGIEDDSVIIWSVNAGKQVGKIQVDKETSIDAITFNPEGTILESGGRGDIILWDVQTRQPIGESLIEHSSWVTSVAFNQDGSILAGVNIDDSIILWDIRTSMPIGNPMKGPLAGLWSVAYWKVVFSPSGEILASGALDNSIRLWDIRTGQQIGEPLLGHTDYAFSVAFSPDSLILASGSKDNTIRFWDVQNRMQIGDALLGHQAWVVSVAFSPDGLILASGGLDGTIRLWDVQTGQQIGMPLQKNSYNVNSVEFNSDGTLLASGSDDGAVRLWNVSVRAWMELACQRAGRNLTLIEWQTYFGDEPYQITCEQWPVDEDALATMDN